MRRAGRGSHSTGDTAGRRPVYVDAGELQRDPGLVPDVQLQQHRREGLDRRGVRQLAGVERAACRGSCATMSHMTSVASGWSEQTSTSLSIGLAEVTELPGRHVVEGRHHLRSGTAACTLAATEPRGGTSGWNSLATRARALAIEITTLPRAGRRTDGGGRGGVPGRGDDDEFGLAAAGLSPRRWASRGRATLAKMLVRTSMARYFDREPSTPRTPPTRAGRRGPPRRSRAAEDPYSHDGRALHTTTPG